MNVTTAFAEVVGPNACLTDRNDIAPYAVDWRGAFQGQPVAVVKPATAAEVAETVRRAAAANLAVVPAGGRTGLCGGAVPLANGPASIVVSLERMNRVRSIDPRDFSIVAEAGCVVQNIQQAAADADRLFPIQWGAQGTAQIGGMLGTNAGGIRTLRWGNARELVLGLEVVLPDGRVLDDLRRVRKDNSGYALRHLFIGAEGTLGIITAAALRLSPRDPLLFRNQHFLGIAHYALGEVARAVELGLACYRRAPRYTSNLRMTLAALAAQGQTDAGMLRAHAALEPGFSVRGFMQAQAFRDPDQRTRYADHLLRAGLPA